MDFDKKDQMKRDGERYKSLTARELNEIAKQDPALYSTLRRGAVSIGLLAAESGYKTPGLRITHRAQTETQHSDEDLRLMVQFPKSECERYFAKKSTGTTDNLGRLRVEDPSKYESLRNASILHNVISGELRHSTPTAAVVKPADDGRIEVGELGKLANLPADYRATHSQYLDLQEADTRRLAARTPQEVAQDRVTALRLEADRVEKSLQEPKQ